MNEDTPRPGGPSPAPDQPGSPPLPPARRRRAWPWVLGVLAALALVVAFAPALFGGLLLARLGEQAGVTAGRVTGPLWSPSLTDAALTQPGLRVQAGRAGVQVAAIDPLKRVVRLNVAVRDGQVNLKLKELFDGLGGGGGAGGGGGWQVLLNRVDVRDTRLTVDGKGVNVPDGQFGVSTAADGTIRVRGRTEEGDLNADVRVRDTAAGPQEYVVRLDADARVINHYWPAVTAGRLTGQYVFGNGPVKGEINLRGGALRVPDAEFVTVTDIIGHATHEGDDIGLTLEGRGWDGPITARGGVSLRGGQENWTLTADARPTLRGLGRALGTDGQGDIDLRVTANGWSTVRVKAYVKAPEGTFAGVDVRDVQAEYTFLNRDGQSTPQTNDVAFSGTTLLAGTQEVQGRWAFGREGRLTWTGEFAGQPLDTRGDIDAQNVVAVSGRALGGPLSGTFALNGARINAVLNPEYGDVRGRIAVRGTPQDLRGTLTGGQAGPFPLSGQATFGPAGLSADLGTVKLDLDPKLRGTWQVEGLAGAGLTLNGAGRLSVGTGDLNGWVAAQVPGVEDTLRGPLTMNFLQSRATFTAGRQVINWRGDRFGLLARDLRVAGGLTVNGNALYTTAGLVGGRLTASGNGIRLTGVGQGRTVNLRGSVNGVNVTADAETKAPFRTQARLDGTGIQATLSVQDGIRFTLNTAGARAQGVIDGQNWTAQGRVNLASLRPLVNVNDLTGTLDLNLRGLGGTARVNAGAQGARVQGVLTRAGGVATADLTAAAQGAVARLTGRVYPEVRVAGTVEAQGQRLNAALTGPYSALTARVTGRTTALTLGGVSLPAQAVNLTGTLTPALTARGRWGDLNVTYSARTGLVGVQGTQALGVAGVSARVTGHATWGPGFQGQVNASGVTTDGEYRLSLRGPWSGLDVQARSRQGLRATGRLALPDLTYRLNVRGPLPDGLSVQGQIAGTGLDPRGTLSVFDAGGGSARVALRGLENFDVTAGRLRLGGQTVTGTLTARAGRLSGDLTAGPLRIVARDGQFTASGTFADHRVQAAGRLTLPSTVANLTLNVDGPYLSGTARGDLTSLRGAVRFKGTTLGAAPAVARVPGQVFPLTASVTPLRVSVGGLTWAGGTWSGAQSAAYALNGTPGRVRLTGSGAVLAAEPTGPLAGRVTLLPTLGGSLSTSLAPVVAGLPAELRRELVPGRLVARVAGTGAALSLSGTRYLGDPLGLNARLSWGQGLRVSGALTHPGTRVPVVFDGRNLSVQGAVLSGRALRPWLPGAQGTLALTLNVPDLNFDRAQGQADVNLSAQGQAARGQVSLRGGQLSANLSSTLAGRRVQVRGPLYPRADAVLTVDGVQGTLTGDARRELRLAAAGTFERQPLTLRVTASGLTGPRGRVTATGTVLGANLDVRAAQGRGAGLAAWAVDGQLSVPDLRPLAGTDGRLAATLGGTLADLRASVSGQAAGVGFGGPVRYAGGSLSVSDVRASRDGVQAVATGTVFPTLNLQARAQLDLGLPGTYTAQVRGSLSRLLLDVQGVLRNAPQGLQAGGSRVAARLSGKDWRASFTGAPLSGTVRGQLGANALGGLLDAALTVNAPFLAEGAAVRLSGTTGWNAKAGWKGSLRAVGDLGGEALDAFLDGRGALDVTARLGTGTREANLRAQLPASLPFRPGGTVALSAFDVGALWGRAGQLAVSGQGTLGGRTWAALEARFAGRVADTAGELSGDLGLNYRAGNVDVRLAGPRVQGGGTLQDGVYRASLRADAFNAARLLPAGLDLRRLSFAGSAEVRGKLARGPELVTLRGVAVQGEHTQAGPFTLFGSGEYRQGAAGQPGVLSAALAGSLRGGALRLDGSLPAGVRLTVRDVPLTYPGAASLGEGQLTTDLTLRGTVQDPAVEGTLTARTRDLDARATVAGRLRDPDLTARVSLLGATSGTLYAQASGLDLARGTAQVRVYGAAAQGEARVNLDLNGTWPALRGTLTARLDGLDDPVTLTGDGQGGYDLTAGQLGGGRVALARGSGFVPLVSGSLALTPLPLVDGTGDLSLNVALSGPVTDVQLAGTLAAPRVTAFGVTLENLTGTLAGPLSRLTGTVRQGGRTVATLADSTLTLADVRAQAAGSTVSLSGPVTLAGEADLTASATGTFGGTVKAAYRAGQLSLDGAVTGPQDLRAALNVKVSQTAGWSGKVRLTGGPAGVLTDPADLTMGGPFAHPRLDGPAGVLGAGVRVLATTDGVQLRFVDGRGATASGVLSLRPDENGEWVWGGAASLTRPELSLSVTPTGPVADPQVLLSVRRGEWQVSGSGSLRRADLSVSDGEREGTLVWTGERIAANLPGLNLARLGLEGVSGVVTASGQVTTGTQDGVVNVNLRGLSTPAELPYLGVDLRGDVQARVTLDGGRPSVTGVAQLPAGTLNLSARQTPQGPWVGQASGTLRRTEPAQGAAAGRSGTLAVNVTASSTGLSGTVNASTYPLDIAGQRLSVNGAVQLQGQTFDLDVVARSTLTADAAGQARIRGSGGLADLLPALQGVLAVRPTDAGYSLNAVLDELNIADLKLAPALSGRVNGEFNLREGGGTFRLESAALRVGAKTLSARLEGTQVSGDWRIRGLLGESEFTAGLSGGEVYGQGNLYALPLGAVVGALTGSTPGEGVVTGVARFRFPLADPLAGTLVVVAERIRVSATSGEGEARVTETLLGSGTLDFAARELRRVNIQLSGAGTWDVRGQYTRESVDLSAKFTGTTFTPVLQLVPALAGLDPSLKGTLTLSAAGTYDRPRGQVNVENLSGTLAGLSLQVPAFAGVLPDSGAFSGAGRVKTGGTVGADGEVKLAGQLTLGKLSGTRVTFGGLLAPQALGALPDTTLALSQGENDTWRLDAQSRSTNPVTGAGSLTLTGVLAPRWDLTLQARNYNLPISLIYARESALNADLRAVDDGTQVRVTGALDFIRLTLGRVNAVNVIPAPGRTTSTDTSQGAVDYASPLPEELTTFPRPRDPNAGEERPALPLLERLVFDDVAIRAPNGIRVDENLARAEFSGNLVLSGTGARPLLTGQITAQRGTLTVRENDFTITAGAVQFDGTGLFPTFDLTATGQVTAVTTGQRVPVTLNVKGQFVARSDGVNALDLTTTLSCAGGNACLDPDTRLAYTEAELYALVATGVPNLTALPGNLAAVGTSAVQTALNLFVLGELERNIARAFGLDVFRFTPNIDAVTGELGATFTVGSYLTRSLYLQYQVDLKGNGLFGATYTTPDNRFTFKVSTPLTGLNLESIKPSFSAGWNFSDRTTFTVALENDEDKATIKFGVTFRIYPRY